MINEPIILQPELRTRLEQSAQQEARTPTDLVSDALEYYFQAKQVEKINQEIAVYEKLHPQLWASIPGEWVAIHNGELVDHDVDEVAVYRRIRTRFPRIAVLLRQVKSTPVEEIWLRTPSTGIEISE
jgi:hypothetical protein